MRFFNTTGPCNPTDHYMLPATARLEELNIDLGLSTGWLVIFDQRTGQPPISQRTTTTTATTPGDRCETVIRA